jgi:hypothetical protein
MKIPKTILLVAYSLVAAFPALAGFKVGVSSPPLELTDLVGFSGQTELTPSTSTWQFTYTLGFVGSPQVLGSATGLELVSGLWGGSGLRSSAVTNVHVLNLAPTASLTIPAGALLRDYIPAFSTSPVSRPVRVSPAVIQAANVNLQSMGGGFTYPLEGRLWEIFIQDDLGQRQTGLLAKPALLTLPYTDANQNGVVDESEGIRPVRVETISIWWLDEAHGNWVRLPDPTINRSANTVTADIHHFSVFAVMGGPSFNAGDTHAFPVPWRPSGGTAGSGAGQSGTLSGGITFNNLPSLCTIHIYTLSGSRVKEIDHTSGTPQEVWDVRSDSGEEVATGTYLWVVDANGTKKSGKLAVIR